MREDYLAENYDLERIFQFTTTGYSNGIWQEPNLIHINKLKYKNH